MPFFSEMGAEKRCSVNLLGSRGQCIPHETCSSPEDLRVWQYVVKNFTACVALPKSYKRTVCSNLLLFMICLKIINSSCRMA